MGSLHNCLWILFTLAQVFQFVTSDYDINWIYPPLLKLLVNKKAIASIKPDRPFKAGLIPYKITYGMKNYEMTFIIYPNRKNGTNWWNENDWIISSLNHKNTRTARYKANNNNNNPIHKEITERNTEDGIKIYIYPTQFKRKPKKKNKKRSHRQFPYECRAKIVGLNVPETDMDIVKYPWKKVSKQIEPKQMRETITLTAIMKLLTEELEISDIIFKDNIQRKCRHNGEVSLREIATFQTPHPWYDQFGFVMDKSNEKIKEMKFETLEDFCLKTKPSWNKTVVPFLKHFQLATNETVQDLMAHFVSDKVKKDKWIVKRKVKGINDDDPQRNCKSFQDIVEAIKKCNVKVKYLWERMEKDTTLKYSIEKLNEESESVESARSNEYDYEYEYDGHEYDTNEYLMVKFVVGLLLLVAIIGGCVIGFIVYNIEERYNVYKGYNSNIDFIETEIN